MNLRCCTYYSVYIKGLSHCSLVIVTIMISDGSVDSVCCFQLSLINTANFPKLFKNVPLRFHNIPLVFAGILKHTCVQTWSNAIYSNLISAWLHKCRWNLLHCHLIRTDWFVGKSTNVTNRWISHWRWNFLISHRSFKSTLKVMCLWKQVTHWVYFLKRRAMCIPLQSNKVYSIQIYNQILNFKKLD